MLFSFVDGGWSTAVETGAELIAARRPEFADTAHAFLARTPVDDKSRTEIHDWLIQELDAVSPKHRRKGW